MSHAHDHTHDLATAPERRILVALLLTVAAMAASIVGGLLSHSLALLSDAGHMLADAGALLLALVAQRLAARPRTDKQTYGWRRAETLAAFVNAIFLGAASLWVIGEAIERWKEPPVVAGRWMFAVAVGGLLVNVAAAWVLSRGHRHNANTRAALAHVLSDVAGSVAAMLAAAMILAWGWNRADPIISLFLALLILWSAWKLVAQAAGVLMEGAPEGLAAEVESTLRGTPGVANVHDLHVWRISEGFDVVTAHVVLDGSRHGTDVSRDACDRVHERLGIEHVTIQAEPPTLPAEHFQPLSTVGRRPTDRSTS
jgi:cobalt-zinc-cadmium efflux system protein